MRSACFAGERLGGWWLVAAVENWIANYAITVAAQARYYGVAPEGFGPAASGLRTTGSGIGGKTLDTKPQ